MWWCVMMAAGSECTGMTGYTSSQQRGRGPVPEGSHSDARPPVTGPEQFRRTEDMASSRGIGRDANVPEAVAHDDRVLLDYYLQRSSTVVLSVIVAPPISTALR